MPVNVTYPGVYIDEVPSAVRTIIGVPSATAAFVGPAARGPVNVARHITSWADFERTYGGLSASSKMSYAVYHFYLNGGSEAEVVRIVGANNAPSTAQLRDGPLLKAKYPGAWGNKLRARVDYRTDPALGATAYNLTVRDTGSGAEERFANVSTDPSSPRSLIKALASSALVTVDPADADLGKRPTEDDPVAPGTDPFADSPKSPPGSSPPATPHFYVQGSGGQDGGAVGDTEFRGGATGEADKQGIYALLSTDIFNMLCIPDAPSATWAAALALCVARRAMLLLDPPNSWTSVQAVRDDLISASPDVPTGADAKNAAVYFPRIELPDPLQGGLLTSFGPSGAAAGVFARTDAQRGVWKAPAGIDASINGVQALTVPMTDLENGELNPLGVNCVRAFPIIGPVFWGARTLRGADAFADQWKYVPVRRTALFIEESLFRGTKWVVFEPNDEPLWAQIRLNVGAFMNSLFRQGAFQGRTPREAYLVKCDAENNPQNDIDKGIVNILVGFAPLKPAEFVIIHIQQLAGQLQV